MQKREILSFIGMILFIIIGGVGGALLLTYISTFEWGVPASILIVIILIDILTIIS